jgi:phosphoribosylformylglycinamidine synthase PurS subunit
MAKVKIFVTAKQGILDPAGKAAESALRSLGYKNVSNLHIGKYIELEVPGKADTKQIDEMCKKLLVNPIIEDFRFEVIE